MVDRRRLLETKTKVLIGTTLIAANAPSNACAETMSMLLADQRQGVGTVALALWAGLALLAILLMTLGLMLLIIRMGRSKKLARRERPRTVYHDLSISDPLRELDDADREDWHDKDDGDEDDVGDGDDVDEPTDR